MGHSSSPKNHRVFLVRHGQTAWNASGRAQGHTEIPLDEIGRTQAERVGERLARAAATLPGAEVWSSDLGRCRETAAPLLSRVSLPVTYHPELRERTFGAWEGEPLADIRLRLDDLAREAGLASTTSIRPPGGESFEDVWNRVSPIAERLAETLKLRSVIVVSHGGLSSLLLARLISASPETARSFRLRNTSVTELELRPDGAFQLLRFDDTTHLE